MDPLQLMQTFFASNPQLVAQFMQTMNASLPPPAPPAPIPPVPPASPSIPPPAPLASQSNPLAPPTAGPSAPSLPPIPAAVAPIQTYVSPMQMLASLSGSSLGSGSLGHPHPISGSAFPSTTMIQNANRDRREHGAAVSEQRKRKPRGRGAKPPRLGRVEPTIDDCLAVSDSNQPVVNLDVLVYLPQPSSDQRRVRLYFFLPYSSVLVIVNFQNHPELPSELYHYVQNGDGFQTISDSLGLFYRWDNLELTTKVIDLLERLHFLLQRHGWNFPEISSSALFSRRERLPVQLLQFVARGNINNNARTPRLMPGKVTEEMTLSDIVHNRHLYAIPRFAIHGNRLLLHTSMFPSTSFFRSTNKCSGQLFVQTSKLA